VREKIPVLGVFVREKKKKEKRMNLDHLLIERK